MMACASRAGLEKQSSWLPGICTSRGGFHLPVRASEPWCVERYGIVEGLDVSDSRAKDNDTLIEEQEEVTFSPPRHKRTLPHVHVRQVTNCDID